MSSPYVTQFTETPVTGEIQISRQELITYQWRSDTLFKITTVRQFSCGGSDYVDTQTVTPVWIE